VSEKRPIIKHIPPRAAPPPIRSAWDDDVAPGRGLGWAILAAVAVIAIVGGLL
jgi:hypothetical protein